MNLNLLCFKNLFILDQLKLEEALLRTSNENFCIINEGSTLAIVLGAFYNLEKLINLKLLKKTYSHIPLIKRFSGGGTVIVDKSTIFITFIINTKDANILPYPERIFNWANIFYSKIIDTTKFQLKENDFIINNKKFAGNAQYIQKNRFLIHTSILWDFSTNHMNILKLPVKRPLYREDRNHEDFLYPLKNLYASKKSFILLITKILKKIFILKQINYTNVKPLLNLPHRKTTKLITDFT